MSNLKVCRICLNTNVRMYHYNKYQLKTYYEEIMANKISERDSLPCHFCYECATMLYKFHKFKEKCFNGRNYLKMMLFKGPIALESIQEVDRKSAKLQSLIDIITVNHRVRTYVVKSQIKETVEPVILKELEIASSSDDNDDNQDNSLDYDSKDVEIETKNIFSEEILVENLDGQENIVVESLTIIEDDAESDDCLLSDYKLSTNKEVEVEKKKKNKSSTGNKKKKEDSKAKRFEVTDKKKNDLDPNNWLKLNLTEEEAVEEFKARGQHKKYLSAKFKCTDCLKGFSKADMLTRHVKLRHDESLGPNECRFCHMRFKWNCFLNKHMRQHYTKYKCLRCDLICALETTALFHEEYHNGVLRKCKHCGEEFKHLTTYYTHLRTHRSEHVCTLCGASFVSPIGLRIHRKIKHVNPEKEVSQGEDQYCERCDIKFETRKAFEEHLVHSAKHDDGLDDLHLMESTASNPRKRRHMLKRYMKIPTDCHICGKHFATQTLYRKHHLAEHPRTSFFAPNERHICEVCGVSLAPSSVTSHLNIHTREKLYNCKTCGRQFNSKGGMTTHQLTHTSEKPVACTLCDKRFKQVSSMRLHYRTFHLKEPYPKRNRKKKNEDISKLDDFGHEESEENIGRWR